MYGKVGIRLSSRTLVCARACVVLTLLAVAMFAVVASQAQAFGIATFDGDVSNQDGSAATQAGSHPFSASTEISLQADATTGLPDASVRDFRVDLPPGLIGDPSATPVRCSEAALNSDAGCPLSTQVGVVTIQAGNASPSQTPLYNTVPPPGVPAAFGFVVASVPVHLLARVRTESDYGLTIDVPNISQGLVLNSTKVTFWGVPADPSHDAERGVCLINGGLDFNGQPCSTDAPRRPFVTNPTICSPANLGLTTTLFADSWKVPGVFDTSNFVSHLPAPNQNVQ